MPGTGIVYVSTVKDCEAVAEELQSLLKAGKHP